MNCEQQRETVIARRCEDVNESKGVQERKRRLTTKDQPRVKKESNREYKTPNKKPMEDWNDLRKHE